MKDFYLLSALSKNESAKKPEPVKVVEAVEVPTEYRVYLLESRDESKKICIPVDNVDAFDAFCTESPELIADTDMITEKFAAIILN